MQTMSIVILGAIAVAAVGFGCTKAKPQSTSQVAPGDLHVIVVDADDATTEIEYGADGDLAESFEFVREDGSVPEPADKWFEVDGMHRGQTLSLKSWMKDGSVIAGSVRLDKGHDSRIRVLVHADGSATIEEK